MAVRTSAIFPIIIAVPDIMAMPKKCILLEFLEYNQQRSNYCQDDFQYSKQTDYMSLLCGHTPFNILHFYTELLSRAHTPNGFTNACIFKA